LAHSAADRIAQLANPAVERVSPYAQQAVSVVSPYAQQAADRIGPIATSAKQRGARVAHDAVDKIAPVLDEALVRVPPAVEAARGKVSGEIVPKISEALSAAAGAPVVDEGTKRGKAAAAADLEPPQEKKGGWLKWLILAAGIAGVAVFLVRKFLGSRDADWQAARPTTPYAPPKPAEPARTAAAGAPVADANDDAHEDPQGGLSAHLLNLEADGAAVPDQPAEGGEFENRVESETAAAFVGETPSEMPTIGDETPTDVTLAPESAEPGATEEAVADSTPTSDEDTVASSEPSAPAEAGASKYQGEGVYVGAEPPEGFSIKGNERSMKYHVPESAGYNRTVAEVWFNSEEAAQQAGFVRAQR
jgi:hypothetical protein